ncbi:DUF4400 domain-containing protein [Azohydromonas aeria]|uniref:DUF4400 domain-containing protein n=1 Tax=Azohydromonas aeria TaxID=2590212 RepID=UPI0012F8E069|nr:DUF4400 domain-containing protein [Azohydromonas aeria]
MIRATAVVSLLGLLVLVLYLPSALPAERFLTRLRAEHEAAVAFWGPEHATRLLARALDTQETARAATPHPDAAMAAPGDVGGAVSRQMAGAVAKLFDNPYFRSIDALLLLAGYRAVALVEWLPWTLVVLLAAGADALASRAVKAREFRRLDPEMFAAHASAAVMAGCLTMVCAVAPMPLHPLVMPCAPLVVGLLGARALGCFHQRG